MKMDFDSLISEAEILVEKYMGVDLNIAPAYAQGAISLALIAIAQELHRSNDERELEEYRQERLKDSAFAE